MPDRHSEALSARLNSEKSSTYGTCVEQTHYRAQSPRQGLGGVAARRGRPAIRHVRIEEDSAGQRLDNFLVRLLKGVPEDARLPRHPVGRGARQQGPGRRRHPARARRRGAGAAGAGCAPTADAAPPAPPREFPVCLRGRLAARARQAGRRRGARRQRRQLRRHRATAAGPAGGAVPRAGAPARQGDLGLAAARQEALGADWRCRTSSASARDRWQDLRRAGRRRWPDEPEGDRRAAAQVSRLGRGERRVRTVDDDARRRPALDHAGQRGAALRATSPCST